MAKVSEVASDDAAVFKAMGWSCPLDCTLEGEFQIETLNWVFFVRDAKPAISHRWVRCSSRVPQKDSTDREKNMRAVIKILVSMDRDLHKMAGEL